MAGSTKLFQVHGDDQLLAAVKKMEEALLAAAPIALEKAAEPTIAMMKRLVRKDTHKLEKSIRFRLGNQGEPKTMGTKRRRNLRNVIVGHIIAGNETTMVKGRKESTRIGRMKNVKRGRKIVREPERRAFSHHERGFWQNAFLQEFGTQKMKAKPFFYPSFRASKTKMKRIISLTIGKALREAAKGTQFQKAPKAKPAEAA